MIYKRSQYKRNECIKNISNDNYYLVYSAHNDNYKLHLLTAFPAILYFTYHRKMFYVHRCATKPWRSRQRNHSSWCPSTTQWGRVLQIVSRHIVQCNRLKNITPMVRLKTTSQLHNSVINDLLKRRSSVVVIEKE